MCGGTPIQQPPVTNPPPGTVPVLPPNPTTDVPSIPPGLVLPPLPGAPTSGQVKTTSFAEMAAELIDETNKAERKRRILLAQQEAQKQAEVQATLEKEQAGFVKLQQQSELTLDELRDLIRAQRDANIRSETKVLLQLQQELDLTA